MPNYEQNFHRYSFPIKNTNIDYTRMHWNLNQVPVIGPWAAKIGKLNRLWSIPCSAPPLIIAEAFFWSLPQLAVDLFKPELLLITKGAFAFKGGPKGRPGSHAAARRRKVKFAIERLLNPKLTPLSPALTRTGATIIFEVGGNLALRLGWYMVVVDATLNGLVNWTSTTYQWAGCLGPDPGYGEGKELAVPFFAGNPDAALSWDVINDGNGVLTSSTVILPPTFDGDILFTATFEPTGSLFQPFEVPTLTLVRLDEVERTPLPVKYVTDDGRKGINYTWHVAPTNRGPRGYEIHYSSSLGTWFKCSPFHIYVQPTRHDALKPDP